MHESSLHNNKEFPNQLEIDMQQSVLHMQMWLWTDNFTEEKVEEECREFENPLMKKNSSIIIDERWRQNYPRRIDSTKFSREKKTRKTAKTYSNTPRPPIPSGCIKSVISKYWKKIVHCKQCFSFTLTSFFLQHHYNSCQNLVGNSMLLRDWKPDHYQKSQLDALYFGAQSCIWAGLEQLI